MAGRLEIAQSSHRYARRAAAAPDGLAWLRGPVREEFEAEGVARGYRTAWARLRRRPAAPTTRPARASSAGPNHRDWEGVASVEFAARLDEWLLFHDGGRIKRSLGWMSPTEYRRPLGMIA